jgi:transcriptional regulator with XRE-family HTH domain
MTEIYRYTSYRDAVRGEVKAMRRLRPGFTLRHVASRISLTPTYLSRVLNDTKSHLSPEHLERIGKLMGWEQDEIEYVQTLRTHESAQSEELRRRIHAKIEELRAKSAVTAPLRTQESFWESLAWAARRSGIKSVADLSLTLGVSRIRSESLWQNHPRPTSQLLDPSSIRELAHAVFAQQERFPEKLNVSSAYVLALTPEEFQRVREILRLAHERISRIAGPSREIDHSSSTRFLVTVSTQLQQWT